MKKLIITLTTSILFLTIAAQIPEKMTYQAVIRNSSDNLVVNTLVGMKISLLQGSSSGTPVYIETQAPTSNQNGLVSIEVGAGTVIFGDFSTIDWSTGSYFIKTETDLTGGVSYSITGVSQLLSVPFALHAKTAQRTTGHYIGEIFGGGIVFSVYKDSLGEEHGLIATLYDLSDTATWGLSIYGVNVPNCKSYWNGQANTSAILLAGGLPTEAAGICDVSLRGLHRLVFACSTRTRVIVQ